MARFNHKLPTNETNNSPRNWFFVDTEAYRNEADENTEVQTLRLGACIYDRFKAKGSEVSSMPWVFKTCKGFWETLFSRAENDRRIYVCAYNMGYDFRILDSVKHLEDRGFVQKGVYFSQAAFLFSFAENQCNRCGAPYAEKSNKCPGCKKARQTIIMIDAMNWLGGKLERWGELLGIPKYEDYIDTDDDTFLALACVQDVRILRAAVHQWFNFRLEHDLGAFAPTKAAQAFNAFRHRFMNHDIFVHADDEALELEHNAYYGGRCETFYVGELNNGPYYMLDVNSLYPYVMANYPVPTKLHSIIDEPDTEWLIANLDKFMFIGDCTIETDQPIYPYRSGGKLIWPVGRFRVCLPHAELVEAYRRGHLQSVHKAAYYTNDIIFNEYVSTMYHLRTIMREKGNEIYESMVKILLNSLYGKFGQRSENWEKCEPCPFMDDGMSIGCDENAQTDKRIYKIGSQGWVINGKTEGMHSFPAIAACITGWARMVLWRIIEKAGKENAYYTDTDSVLVNRQGFNNLSEWMDQSQLGYLELQKQTYRAKLNGAKDYELDNESKTKGVPSTAEIGPSGLWVYPQFEGFRGAIRNQNFDRVIVKQATKSRQSTYDKGYVSSSGKVLPWEVCEA